MSQEKLFMFIILVPSKNDNRCPRKNGLSPVKTIIGVPGKVVYLHYTTVYCTGLSVVLVAFHFGCNITGWLPCWEKLVILCVVGKMFCCVLCISFPTWCLCRDFEFICIDSWSLYSYLSYKNSKIFVIMLFKHIF